MKNYYEVLGLRQNATKDEIKKSYRALAMKYHPDVNSGDVDSEKKFREINEAYETLKDDKKRAEYDNKLSQSQFSEKEKSNSKQSNKQTVYDKPFDIRDVSDTFENFFGFNAKTGDIVNEEKLKKKNPIDTTDIFEKFMGFKK
nr:DnaJ domain-containing protein [Criibacterium bergeronii]